MTHAEFIEALGGGTKVAERLNIDREAVYKWRTLNRVPWKWRPHLVPIAKELNVEMPEDFLPGIAA